MWLSPEGKGIALKKSDFLYGVAAMGQQGMGKTAHMASMCAALLNADHEFGSLICDPKGDLAKAALAYLSPDRKVRYIDFNNPEVGIDPFLLANAKDEQAIVNVVLHGIIDVARTEEDESQIMASSKDFLTNAIFATLTTTVPFGLRPSMFHLRKWISTDPENIKWQKRLLSEVISQRLDRHFIVDAYAEFHSSLERSEAQFTTRAAAPLNKVAELCGEAVDRIIRHPNALNLEECILNREVIIVNGRNHKSADLVFRFLWQMVDQALGRIEAETPRQEERPKFLFVVDESPAILTPTTSQIIARRRSAGLHMMIGWQHDAQISNPKVLSTLRSLLQNVFQFRTSPEDARERVDLMQMTFDDQQDSRLREVRTNRVSVADLINADRFVFYAAHLVDGNRVPTYWGNTIDPKNRPNHAAAHLLDQAADHGQVVDILAAPDLDAQSAKARQQMLFDPPSFPSVTEAEEYARPLMETVGIDFEAELAKMDPTPEELANDHSDEEGGVGTLEPPNEPDGPHETDKPSTTTTVAPSSTNDRNPAVKNPPSDPVPDNRDRNKFIQTSAIDDELDIGRDQAIADAAEVAYDAAGFDQERPKKTIAQIGKVEVGPLGQVIPGEMTKLMEYVDVFRTLDSNASIVFKDPPEEPSASTAARNAKAEQLANTGSLFPANWHKILVAIYEFNYLTNKQIEVITGIGRSTVSQRTNLWLKNGVLRGMEFGGQNVWTLTDLGARVGRHLTNRFGPLIPLEPGKGEEGRYEATRKWTPRNTPNARGIIHDLHLASYVSQFILLCDGDMRVFENPQEGIIKKFRGEFGSVVEPPKVKGRGRTEVPMDLHSVQQTMRGFGFTGINTDDPTLGALSPDAIINLHNLTPNETDPKKGDREVWIELDRQGNAAKLRDKLVRLDVFLGIWWQTVARFRRAGRPPMVLFVAPNVEILKKQLAIADETLVIKSGKTRLGAAKWGAPTSRKRVFFALETDLHKGSMRVYRVPELTPREREANASDQRERTEVRVVQLRMDDLLPKSLLAGRRLGTHQPKGN